MDSTEEEDVAPGERSRNENGDFDYAHHSRAERQHEKYTLAALNEYGYQYTGRVDTPGGTRRPINETDFQIHRNTKDGESDDATSIVLIQDFGFGAAGLESYAELLNSDSARNSETMDAQRLRHHLGLEPDSSKYVSGTIREKINAVVKSNGHLGTKSTYLPIDQFKRILAVEVVKALLPVLLDWDSVLPGWDCSRQLEEAFRRRRILGTLIVMDKLILFKDFLEAQFTDDQLPLTPSINDTRPEARTRGSDKDNCGILSHWDFNDRSQFYSTQMRFFAPFFDLRDHLCSHSLQAEVPLPWECSKHRSSGGFSLVHQISIQESHHNFPSHPGKPLSFALKKISTNENPEQVYKSELAAHDKIWKNPEKHLSRLLATFTHGKERYLLFEWADCNLREYWSRHSSPEARASQTRRRWLANQCLGLARGLRRLHGLMTWQKETWGEASSSETDIRQHFGCHGDIKPENILCFSSEAAGDESHLALSDLGLAHFHSRNSKSLIQERRLGGFSYRYSPPECFPGARDLSSKYDIWSLGCVFLELCTWWLEGFDAVEEFTIIRTEDERNTGGVEKDNFFRAVHGGVPSMEIKPSVHKKIISLREKAQSDSFARSLLDLIEKKMLVINQADRIKSDELYMEIKTTVVDAMAANGVDYSKSAPQAVPSTSQDENVDETAEQQMVQSPTELTAGAGERFPLIPLVPEGRPSLALSDVVPIEASADEGADDASTTHTTTNAGDGTPPTPGAAPPGIGHEAAPGPSPGGTEMTREPTGLEATMPETVGPRRREGSLREVKAWIRRKKDLLRRKIRMFPGEFRQLRGGVVAAATVVRGRL